MATGRLPMIQCKTIYITRKYFFISEKDMKLGKWACWEGTGATIESSENESDPISLYASLKLANNQ